MTASCPDDHELQLEDMSREQVDMRLLAFCVMPTQAVQVVFDSARRALRACGTESTGAPRLALPSAKGSGSRPRRSKASGIGIHVTSARPPKTPPSRPVYGRTTRQIDTNETRPRFPVSDPVSPKQHSA
jgi:hypothetical protein